jgi:hypothetical protein
LTPQGPPKPPVEGLPEGVDLVRIGLPKENEYYILNSTEGPCVYQGQHANMAGAVVVKASEGYTFRANIRTGGYDVVKLLPKPLEITATMTFSVNNSYDQDTVKAFLEKAKHVPGFTGMMES